MSFSIGDPIQVRWGAEDSRPWKEGTGSPRPVITPSPVCGAPDAGHDAEFSSGKRQEKEFFPYRKKMSKISWDTSSRVSCAYTWLNRLAWCQVLGHSYKPTQFYMNRNEAQIDMCGQTEPFCKHHGWLATVHAFVFADCVCTRSLGQRPAILWFLRTKTTSEFAMSPARSGWGQGTAAGVICASASFTEAHFV